MPSRARDLAHRLAGEAEAVCHHYLSNGRREGCTWRVGDVDNHRGGSLCVRLVGATDGARRAGKWTDYASGQHGDLLDLIAAALGTDLVGAMDEAERFLGLPPSARDERRRAADQDPSPRLTGERSCASARRLFAAAQPIQGTLAERYLRGRGLAMPAGSMPLRFLPACRLRTGPDEPDQRWPALIAAVTDDGGMVTGVQRLYLARDGSAKASVTDPCRSLGRVHSHAVRVGTATDIFAVGEGIETMLSLRTVLPGLPVAATLSASHLAAFQWPSGLRQLLIAADRDRAGWSAAERLAARPDTAGLATLRLDPVLGDWNDDLRELGAAAVRARVSAIVGAELMDRLDR